MDPDSDDTSSDVVVDEDSGRGRDELETESPSSANGIPEPRRSRMDVVFGTLQNDRRRHVLEYVRDHGSTTQSELARHVAAMENGIPPEAVDSTQRKRVYISLYQSHLSKLADAGAIAYDPDRGTVERTPMTAEFLEYLERAETPTPNPVVPRARHTLAGAALLLVAVAVPLVPGTGTGSGFSVASVFALVLASLACGLVVRGIVQ